MSTTGGPHLPIETERLLLRYFEPGDIDVLAAMHGDPDLVRWIPWGPRTREQAAEVLERKLTCRTIESEGDGLGIAPVLRETGEMIGDFTLQYVSEEHSVAELGYLLTAGTQGRGYATEASREILRLAFDGTVKDSYLFNLTYQTTLAGPYDPRADRDVFLISTGVKL